MPESTNSITKPFLVWVGGKTKTLKQLRLRYPPGLGITLTKYAEPFVGGGAVLWDILNRYRLEQIYISDLNRELIHTYRTVRDQPEAVINALTRLERAFRIAHPSARRAVFMEKRSTYNTLMAQKRLTLELAVLFMFLNHASYRGYYRVNAHGKYTGSYGELRREFDYQNLRLASAKLQGVRIRAGDYHLARDFIDKRTFVYLDPPYRPLSATLKYQYTSRPFADPDQIRLAAFFNRMCKRGAYLLASNSDPTVATPDDLFFDRLYAPHRIERISAQRPFNVGTPQQGNVRELLISSRSQWHGTRLRHLYL